MDDEFEIGSEMFEFDEFPNLIDSDSIQPELFDGQLNGPTSVNAESDILGLHDDNLGFDSFDLVNFANANVACGTNPYSSSTPVHTRTSVSPASNNFFVQPTKQSAQAQKSCILLQQLKQDQTDNKPSQWQSQGLSIADLLQTRESLADSSLLHVQSVPVEIASTGTAAIDVCLPETLEFLTQAGIQQPAERKIQLHSELAQHLCSQLVDQQKSTALLTPQQVLLSGTAVQQRLVSSSAPQPQQHTLPLRTAASGAQKIIVHQIPATSQQQVQSQLTATPRNVSLPQQIIITTQPQQPVPQPAQISLEQIQQLLMHSQLPGSGNGGAASLIITTSPVSSESPTHSAASSNTSGIVNGSIPLQMGDCDKVAIARLTPAAVAKNVPVASPPMRGEGRSTHNAIEKRYRLSINDRIAELRELIAGKDSKMNKSGVLRKAIEYIKYLQAMNIRLKQENLALKVSLSGHKDVKSLLEVIRQNKFVSEVLTADECPTPLRSSLNSVTGSPCSSISDSLGPQSPLFQEDLSPPECKSNLSSYTGLLDRSRLTLCIFMCVLLVVNPFHLLIQGAGNFGVRPLDMTHTGSRTLQSAESEDDMKWSWSDWFFSKLIIWLLNALIMACVMAKIFVFGEPVTKPLTKSSGAYWRSRSQADAYLARGNYVEAAPQLHGCLQALGRPLPTTKLDLFASLFWNVVRQALHRIGVGHWIEVKAGKLWRSVSSQDIKLSARDAAVVYQKLLQLHLTDHAAQSMWSGVNLALSAVNLGDAAGDMLPKDKLAEIYALAAMTIRLFFPVRCHFLARYFLSHARGMCLSCSYPVSVSLSWLNHPLGHRYFVDAAWTSLSTRSLYSSCVNELDPLAHVTRGFREYLLEKAIYALVTPGYKEHLRLGTDNSSDWIAHHSSEALGYLHLVNQLSAGYETSPTVACGNGAYTTKTGVDEQSRWWAAVLAIAAHWLSASDDDVAAVAANSSMERFYLIVDSIPKALQSADDALTKSVHLSYKARKLCLLGGRVISPSCIQQCNKAGELLRDSIAPTDVTPTSRITKAIQLLVCDWLLSTRTEIWQRECGIVRNRLADSDDSDDSDQEVTSTTLLADDLMAFQHDLTSLRKLAHSLRAAMPRVFLHEATVRLMAGASPARALQRYDRDLRKRHKPSTLSNAETNCNSPSAVSTAKTSKSEKVQEDLLGQESLKELAEQRDQASALLQACRRHLQLQSAAAPPSQLIAMLNEAATTYEKLGDRKALQDCRNMMMQFTNTCSATSG